MILLGQTKETGGKRWFHQFHQQTMGIPSDSMGFIADSWSLSWCPTPIAAAYGGCMQMWACKLYNFKLVGLTWYKISTAYPPVNLWKETCSMEAIFTPVSARSMYIRIIWGMVMGEWGKNLQTFNMGSTFMERHDVRWIRSGNQPGTLKPPFLLGNPM